MHLRNLLGGKQFFFVRKFVVQAAKRVSADLIDFAAPEIAAFVSGRKRFKGTAKSVGRQSLNKQLGSCSKQRKLFPTKFIEQAGRSSTENFANISR